MGTVRAKEPFSFDANGYSHNVAAGALYDSDDPCVIKRPHLFEPVEVATARRSASIETAMAVPGELRTITNPTQAATDNEADTAAWLAAEKQHEEDVQAWLLAEEQYQTDVAAWLAAEVAANVEPEKPTRQTRASK